MSTEKQAELDLLLKLEEQNRMLLSDAKVVPSLSVRRREGSISSSISTGSGQEDSKNNSTSTQSSGNAIPKISSNSGVSLPIVVGWTAGAPVNGSIREQWEYVVNNWDNCCKKRSYVSDLMKKGVTDELRPLVWQLYTGAYDSPLKKLYNNYVQGESPVEKAIRRDIARTFPKHDMFKDENGWGQESLFRVIKAYSLHDREVGYCQGSAFIVGMLLMQMHELDAFAVLVQLMNDYKLREMYKPSMIELGICMFQLEQLIADHLPDLFTHFRTQSFAPSLYASAWFLTLFSTILPIPFATRVMDCYIAEGIHFIFKLALSILKFSAESLLKYDMESMVAYLQHEGPMEWEKNASLIMENACSLKLNSRKMKKLEKEYLAIRSQEREEQVELRRLRTENGLLLQRLTRLEEETGIMANRLVQCQLIRAQEAETLLTLRCELAVIRREQANRKSVTNNFPDDQNELHRNNVTDKPTSDDNNKINSSVNNNFIDEKNSLVKSCDSNKDYSLNYANHIDLSSDNNSDYGSSSGKPHEYVESFTLPRTRHHHHHHPYHSVSSKSSTVVESDSLLLNIINQLQTDLANSRFSEADTRSILHDLKAKCRKLEESKADQAIRSAEQIATLKDQLFASKRFETELVNQMEDLKKCLNELDLLWQTHLSKCKGVGNESKRSSNWIGSLTNDSQDSALKTKFSDRLLEARLLEQINSLKTKMIDLTTQRELADHRADRLDQRISDLFESRTASEVRERELLNEIKQLEQKCADIEIKRKTDGIMWRSREMELKAQLTERRQCYSQLQYQYESLITSQSLQNSNSLIDSKNRKNSTLTFDLSSIQENNNYTLGSYLPSPNKVDSSTTNHNNTNSRLSILESDCSTPQGTIQLPVNGHNNNEAEEGEDDNEDDDCYAYDYGNNNNNNNIDGSYENNPNKSIVVNKPNSKLSSVWKDLPPSIMTESIGPLEELCLVPDDPLITSVYLNGSSC